MNVSIVMDGAGKLLVKFPYSPQMVEAVKTVDYRRKFDAERKAWTFPAECFVLQRLMDLLGVMRECLPENVERLLPAETQSQVQVDLTLADGHAWTTKPYHHQVKGFCELREFPHWALFWEQGSGKSLPVANRIKHGLERGEFGGPVFIFCPKPAVLSVWPQELKNHAGLDCMVLIGGRVKKQEVIERAKESVAGGKWPIVVANYEAALHLGKELSKLKPDVVVWDEIHRMKNATCKTAREMRKLSASARYRWGLSGTPAPNGPLDFFGSLLLLDPLVAGTESKMAFTARYAITQAVPGQMYRQVVGYQNLEDLRKRVASISSRVKKADCLDLPEKIFADRHCELEGEQARVYRQLRNDAIARLKVGKDEGELTIKNILQESLRLLQVCGGHFPTDDGEIHHIAGSAKLSLLADLLEDIDGKVIIWTVFREEVKAIVALLAKRADGDAVEFHGGVADGARKDAVDRFQNGDASFFVGTMATGRESITLTAASTEIFYSRDWNLVNYLQSIDRAHRIGTKKAVTIYHLVARGTVDEKVAASLSRKESLQERLLGRAIDPEELL